MPKTNILLKEIFLFLFGVLIICGVAGFIDFLRELPINWGDRLFKCILAVILIRLFMLMGSAGDKKKN
ncbi:hypothetical protein NSQ77_05245 [Oceanobacillus sp. FSL K6-2867]|uniref:hypothetical protein n=1 Tax=Oceanobacillus sp. FSL K6-2867 TaxID=2954748 RepID=UPI0030DBA9F3